MRGKPDRILSGWRAGRMLEAGGLLVRDGAAFRLYQRTDERSARCGRAPAHVVARLRLAPGLAAFRGDPDRLAIADVPAAKHLKPLPVPSEATGAQPPKSALLDRVTGKPPTGIRLRAAAARFLADYHLAASTGRLRTDAPKALSAARERLAGFEAVLGADRTSLLEMLVLDKMSLAALRHVTGAGPEEARDSLVSLAQAYGLAVKGQEAGSVLASA